MRIAFRLLMLSLGPGIAAIAQENPSPAIFETSSKIDAALERSNSALGIVAGRSTQVFGADSGRLVVRRRVTGPNNASVHDYVTEIYYIISGAATLVTGGTIADPNNRSAGIAGGVDRDIAAGDFVILPPGTAHWFSDIQDSIAYIETRFTVEQ